MLRQVYDCARKEELWVHFDILSSALLLIALRNLLLPLIFWVVNSNFKKVEDIGLIARQRGHVWDHGNQDLLIFVIQQDKNILIKMSKYLQKTLQSVHDWVIFGP